MKKFLSVSLSIAILTLVFLIKTPTTHLAFAEVPDGTDCTPDASICTTPQTCVDINGEGKHSECQTPPLAPGAACSTKETRCPAEQICVPDTAGSETGTCKAATNGAICDPQDPNSCGSYITSPFTCDQDPNNGTIFTCQSVSCDPKFGSEECLRASYYCNENPAGSGKGLCMYSTNPPGVNQAPGLGKKDGPPCAATGLVDVKTPELDKDGNPKKDKKGNPIMLEGQKCASFLTAFGTLSTEAGEFIRSGFGLLLAASGAVALLLIIRAGYKIMTSQGKPETVQEARDQLIAAIVGLVFLIFAFVFLEVIGVDILRIPGLTGNNGSTPDNLSKGQECIIGPVNKCAGQMVCFNKPDSKKGEKGTCQ